MAGLLKRRSVIVAGHKTSVSLETPFWDALAAIARRRNESINALVSKIDQGREGNLSSAIRVFVLKDAQRNGAGASAAEPPEAP